MFEFFTYSDVKFQTSCTRSQPSSSFSTLTWAYENITLKVSSYHQTRSWFRTLQQAPFSRHVNSLVENSSMSTIYLIKEWLLWRKTDIKLIMDGWDVPYVGSINYFHHSTILLVQFLLGPFHYTIPWTLEHEKCICDWSISYRLV